MSKIILGISVPPEFDPVSGVLSTGIAYAPQAGLSRYIPQAHFTISKFVSAVTDIGLIS